MASTDTYYLDGQGRKWIDKDPDAELDYPFNWADYLEPLGDTIASVAWVIHDSLTQYGQGSNATSATIWVRDGVKPAPGEPPVFITCRITTNSTPARVDDRTIFLKIKER